MTHTVQTDLPNVVLFPEVGTSEFDEAIELAKTGVLRFGLQDDGVWLDWDLNETSHGLIGGKTGSGKSVALSIVLFYALYLPDYFDIIVCDPKRTDFTWTPEYPSVITHATTDTEICAAIRSMREQMNARQALLNKANVRNLSWLRKKIAETPELANEYGPVPKRLILLFDEIADFLTPGPDEELEELKKTARTDLETIGRLGRANETNIVAASHKLGRDVISSALRVQLAFRLSVGQLDQHESQKILNSDHATRFPESGTPKGRAWAYDPKGGYRQVQLMYLPDETHDNPADTMQAVTGARDRVSDQLRRLGYERAVRWVRA